VLEAHAVQRVRELDVHAQVVGIELQLIAGLEALFVDIHRQRGNVPSKDSSVRIAAWMVS